jgi:hypothetical protein
LLNYKALFAGALTIFAVELLARILSRPWMVAQIEGFEENLRTAAASNPPPTISVAEYTQNQMWPLVVVSLSISAVACFLGGYVVGRLAHHNYFLNAILAFVLVVGGSFIFYGNGFQEQPMFFVPKAAVGILITIFGCTLGIKQSTSRN